MTVVTSKPSGTAAPVRGSLASLAATGRQWWTARAGRLSCRLWYDRPVRWQLLATFILINAVAVAVAGAIVIRNAHEATLVEVAASMEVAEQVIRKTAEQLAQEAARTGSIEESALHALEIIPLRLRHLRHVRLSVSDASGRRIPALAAEAEAGPGREEAPHWFKALFQLEKRSRDVPIALSGRHIGTVRVTSQPADEIAEVWHDVSDLAVVVLIANIAVIVLFRLALGRALNPLTSLAAGLGELEHGRFTHRLPRPKVREIADIVDRFNALAGALETARVDNARLNRRLITAQDDERRQIATELHDELGACLFGLRANVLSVRRLAESEPGGASDLMRKRIDTLAEVSERMQTANRRVLRSLRPMALGHAPLADVIRDLVADFTRNAPEQAFDIEIGALKNGYSDCIDLTVYRCIQEGLTNAVRHAGAKAIAVRLEELTLRLDDGLPSAALRLTIADDGRGLAPGTVIGLGLTGMERRVTALGGAFAVTDGRTGGARLDITIPVEEREASTGNPAATRAERS